MKIALLTYCVTVLKVCASEPFDSVRVFKMEETVVTGSRFQNEVQKLPVSVQVIDSVLLQSYNGSSVAEILKKEAGIFVRSYGGKGSLQSVSLRGMSSDYTLILVDGKRFTTFQIGTIDLGIFSLADVERIEIIRGSNSAAFGADAVGGVINIVTKKGAGERFVAFSHSFGSFGQQSIGADAGGVAAGLLLYAGGNVESGKNDFTFRYNDGRIDTTLQRTGADYTISTFTFSAAAVDEALASKLSFRLSSADRGQPSPLTSQFQDNHARIHDNDAIGLWNADWKISERLLINTSASFRYNHETYSDQNLITDGKPLSSYYFNRMGNCSASVQYSLNELHQLFFGTEAGYGNISSNEVRSAERKQFSIFTSTQHHVAAPVDVFFYPSVRYDSFTDVGDDVSPKLGVNVGLTSLPEVRLRTSYGKNYRVPTFNDLYWNTGGNGTIRPERLLSADAGIIVTTNIVGSIECEVNYFSIKTKDKIVWTPGASNIWTPLNVSAVSSDGFEMSGQAILLNDILKLRYNHTITNVIKTSADVVNDQTQGKRLRYTPRETASFLLGCTFNDFSINTVYSFTGFRYLQNDNNPRFILPSFETVDLNCSYSIQTGTVSVSVKIEGNNIFNEEYSFISGYPIPLRNYSFSTHVRIQ